MNISVFYFVALNIFTGLAICQSEPYLDVTALKIPKSTNHAPVKGGISSGCVGDTGRPCRADLPVKIHISSIDKSTYYLGQPIILEVRLENVGDKPISMPWTVDWRLTERRNARPDSLLVTVIAPLIVGGANGKDATDVRKCQSVSLYGSLDVPGTSVSIPPGGTARLRISADSFFRTENVVFPLETSLKAKIEFLKGPLSKNRFPAVSGNSVPVTILQGK